MVEKETKKAVFCDIDGTLWDRKNYIPESTKEAIKLLKDNGHKVLICTGRTTGYITSQELLGLGFDGMVSGLGTMIEIDSSILSYYRIGDELMRYTLEQAFKYKMKPILEGKDYLYMEHEDFDNDPYGEKLFAELGDRALPIKSLNSWECSKFSCDMAEGDKNSFYKAIGDYYDILEHNDYIAEFVPKGYSKGVGIINACKHMGIDIKDSVVIGDGANDIDMFKVAGISICMGDGAQIAKDNATYVTDALHLDGFYNGLKHFSLI